MTPNYCNTFLDWLIHTKGLEIAEANAITSVAGEHDMAMDAARYRIGYHQHRVSQLKGHHRTAVATAADFEKKENTLRWESYHLHCRRVDHEYSARLSAWVERFPLVGSFLVPFSVVATIGVVLLAARAVLGPIASVFVALGCAAFAGLKLQTVISSKYSPEELEGLKKTIINLDDQRAALTLHQDRWNRVASEIQAEIAEANRSIAEANRSIEQIKRSIAFNAERFLAIDWRSMRGAEFEVYLAQVGRHLGYGVEECGQSGDHGVDLVYIVNDARVAIQVKGYAHPVGNTAVQEAVAGMAIYDCQYSAVITNSKFTRGAIALADANNCNLIGESDFEEFIKGSLDLVAS